MSATATGETKLETISRIVSPRDVKELVNRHPRLSFDPNSNVIAGELHIQASYRGDGKGC